MREAGIGWVRVDFLWHDIEPAPGQLNFSKYDRIVEVCLQHNIQILGLLNYNTPWSNASGKWNCPPKENKDFVNYATTLIQRYKGRVSYWEVWNEPDSAVYWAPQDGLKSYCVLLKEVYIAAKRANPECKILNGGLAEGLASVNKLYENGAQGYFDILNIHVFQTPINPVAIKAVLAFPRLAYKVMRRNGDAGKKIWITEIGCPGVPAGIKTDKWWLGENPDEAQQAAWAKQIYPALLKEGYIQNVFWAFFRDCKEHWKSGVDYFGLIRWDFSKKPSFKAYQDCVLDWKKSIK